MKGRLLQSTLAVLITACASTAGWAQSNAPIIYGDMGTMAPNPQTVQTPDTSPIIEQELYQEDVSTPETTLYMSDPYQAARTTLQAAPAQDFCITVMAGFPQDDGTKESLTPRYQFYKLVQHMAVDATGDFTAAMTHYIVDDIDPQTPAIDIIEAIANPVLRQAAPELAVANMAHLIDFAQTCETYIDGQITSLTAFNPTLAEDDLIIQEDALYLRQILSDSLSRLGADAHPTYARATQSYSGALIIARDNIEFASFETELEDLEALYMTDLDGRLARSNDMINSEINRETLGDAISLADDMNSQAKRRQKEEQIRTLFRILNGL